MPGASTLAPERSQTRTDQVQHRGGSDLSDGSLEARPAQHMQALARANAVRLARASLKRAVARGERTAAEIVLESPWEAQSMTIGELLSAQRRWGQARTRKLLNGLSLTETKALGTLTQRQRLLLASALEGKRRGS